ncbi:MAG: dihydroorotate dehydrogenase electron transfer subunit [Bacteroidales bacterium]|jgi:dihydroorotate dehydrogenase electron transfer subunit|nr:dihydroorotate dehydrogenase electron transfer subunit [Bacteroidales bacterium]
MSKRIEDFRIIDNKRLNSDLFVLELKCNSTLPEIKPGQFVQVRIDGSPETFLRRPISVHDVNIESDTIKLLIQIKGKGTERLSFLRSGDMLNLIYPLGNSFSMPEQGEKILITGGGCGVAPLLYLGKYLKSMNYKTDVLLGFKNADRIAEYDEYQILGDTYLTTEDGSEGVKGVVTDHPVLREKHYDRVYCCGPEPMMKAVAHYCHQNDILCEVSLEHLMACGFGVCLCCVVDTLKGNICTCTEGPVFNISDLQWQTPASQ